MEQNNKIKILIALFLSMFLALALVFSVEKLILILFCLLAITALLFNPKILFYCLVFTIPLSERIRIFPVSFSVNDIFIFLCTLSVLVHLAINHRKINLKTKLDIWIAALILLFIYSGVFSEGNNGILTTLKFIEAVIVYYLSIYFIRGQQIKISKIVKIIFIVAILEGILGAIQSLTGIGSSFSSSRGILGYLGIGSSLVHHAKGTLGHFNSYGTYMTMSLLFSVSFFAVVLKQTVKNYLLYLIEFFGMIFSYSRGSLMGLFFGGIYFLFIKIKNKIKFLKILIVSTIPVILAKIFLTNTDYINTISYRNPIWKSVIASILESKKHLWLGGGLNSYAENVYLYLPQNDVMWFAHNYFLLAVQETGLIGFILITSFLLFVIVDTYRFAKKYGGLKGILNTSCSICVFSVIFVSIFDHSFALPYFKIFIFLILGLAYAKNK